jgi:hypothetical protein
MKTEVPIGMTFYIDMVCDHIGIELFQLFKEN